MKSEKKIIQTQFYHMTLITVEMWIISFLMVKIKTKREKEMIKHMHASRICFYDFSCTIVSSRLWKKMGQCQRTAGLKLNILCLEQAS